MAEEVEVNTQKREKTKQVYVSYLKWFLGAGVLAIIGTIAAYLLNTSHPLSGFQIRVLQIFSLVLEAVSLGQCGYSIQTWGGVSPAEKLNQKLFTAFSSMGFFLIIFSFQLESLQSV